MDFSPRLRAGPPDINRAGHRPAPTLELNMECPAFCGAASTQLMFRRNSAGALRKDTHAASATLIRGELKDSFL